MRRFLNIMILLSLVLSVSFIGCILDPKPDKNPPDLGPQKEFKPLTEKENVIYNLVLSYARTDIAHYEELLHEDYIWVNQPRDQEEFGEFYRRADDIRMVRHMFEAVNGRYKPPIDRLELTIPIFESDSLTQSERWSPVPELENGEPCEDCWETERIYTIKVDIGDKTYIGDDKIRIIITSVIDEDNVKKYKILRAIDTPK